MNIREHLMTVAFVALFLGTSTANDATINRKPIATPNSIGGVLEQVGITPRLGEQVPLDLLFTDSNGKATSLRQCLAGRPTIVQLVYYDCPMLCQLSRDGLMSTIATINL